MKMEEIMGNFFRMNLIIESRKEGFSSHMYTYMHEYIMICG